MALRPLLLGGKLARAVVASVRKAAASRAAGVAKAAAEGAVKGAAEHLKAERRGGK